MQLFSLKHFSYYYSNSESPALDNITIEINNNEFILVTGASGSGKTTFVKALSGLLGEFYGGVFSGELVFMGSSVLAFPSQMERQSIGMVFQDPEKQLVMKSVEAELAFGLENLGLERKLMQRRVAEVSAYFGLSMLMRRDVNELSSGEKQKVVIASIVAMLPKVLILDEPTSQLSLLAAEELISLLKRLHEDLDITIIIIEQNIDICAKYVSRVLHFQKKKITADIKPNEWCNTDIQCEFLPTSLRICKKLSIGSKSLHLKDCRLALNKVLGVESENERQRRENVIFKHSVSENILELKNLKVGYKQSSVLALDDVSFTLGRGEILAVVGENGAGKTTLLRAIAGELPSLSGSVLLQGECIEPNCMAGKIAYLGQDPNLYLFNETIEEELRWTLRNFGREDGFLINDILSILGLLELRYRYPRELSTGERQRAALASILVIRPTLLLLDEPTRGLDPLLKMSLVKLLKQLRERHNLSVIIATQDIEFASLVANRAAVLFCGKLLELAHPAYVFHDNLFWTTTINRLFRGIRDYVVSEEDAQCLLEGQ